MIRFVYRFDDAAGAPLYVGCTQDLTRRIKAHRSGQPWWPDVASISVSVYPSLEAGRAAERAAVSSLKPAHNLHLVDDNAEEWFQRWSRGESMTVLGRERGVSRQYVFQELARTQPAWMLGLTKRRNIARRRIKRAAAEHRDRTDGALLCFVCGYLALGHKVPSSLGAVTCGGDCADMLQTLQLHIAGARRDAFRLRLAVNSPSVTYRKNLASGTVKSQGEWFVNGSAAWRAAHVACERRLPIFDALTEAKQAQILSERSEAAA